MNPQNPSQTCPICHESADTLTACDVCNTHTCGDCIEVDPGGGARCDWCHDEDAHANCNPAWLPDVLRAPSTRPPRAPAA